MATVSEEEYVKQIIAPSMDARRLKQPNRKKHEEELEALHAAIREKEKSIKSLGTREDSAAILKEIKAEREATIERRKKIDTDLKLANQEITKKMGCLTKLQSSLHYKNEERINEAIRRLEWQLHHQNFKLTEERKIVAEVDSLKRSKKILGQYLAEKKEIDEMRDKARRMREERDHYYRAVTNLKNKEDALRKTNTETKTKHTDLKQEIDELYEKKRRLIADFRRQEKEYLERKGEFRKKQRLETIKKKEEERRVKNEAMQKEYEDYTVQKQPYDDKLTLCTSLILYLQRCHGNLEPEVQPSGDSTSQSKVQNNPVSELDGGMYVLKKRQEDDDFTVPRKLKRSRKSRKQLMPKLLSHTTQVFAQFDSLNLRAPANMTEVQASIEQLIARKTFYEEVAAECSDSYKAVELEQTPQSTEHTVWPYGVWGIKSSTEDQSQSENGLSVTESGGGEMSRQLSKTESSGSLQDTIVDDNVIEELVKLSTEDSVPDTDIQKQYIDKFDSGTLEHSDEEVLDSANENRTFISENICKSDEKSDKNVCSMSICNTESNDDNSTVVDSDCSRQNSSNADSTDCTENDVCNPDYQGEQCCDIKETVIEDQERQDFSTNCADRADIETKCLVTGTDILHGMAILSDVEGENTLLMT